MSKKEELIKLALKHSSYANQYNTESNERLELLGDSVISLSCISYLYNKYPTYDEGQITAIKADLVSGDQLAEFGRFLELETRIQVGQSTQKITGKIIGRAVEALFGAIYINSDSNMASVNGLLHPMFDKIDTGEIPRVTYNYKGDLQKYTQKEYKEDPKYTVCKITGPDHSRVYTVKAEIKTNSSIYGFGQGCSIKEAEQNAAKDLLSTFS